MGQSDAVERLLAIPIGGAREYLYPEAADPQAIWQVPVGTITLRNVVNASGVREVNELRIDLSGEDQEADEYVEEVVSCPHCRTSSELTVCGRWGDVPRLHCPCGHEWTPGPEDPAWGRRLLRTAIGQTIAEHGLPEAAVLRR